MKTFLPSLRRSLILQVLILATLLPGLTLFTVPLQANPSGASVVHGNVAFNGLGTSQLNITQGSQNAIINWQSFSIQSGETTTFIQPNQSSVALNRVVGVDPSAIYGTLNANGGVIVINPNGILVGPGGRIDVAGMLTMSTLDIDDNDFLDGGPMRFRGSTEAGIRNYGAISSSNGDVVLLGNFLQNAGEVSSATGTVAFGAGGDIVVNETSNGGKISVLAGGIGGDTGIENAAAGEIHAAAAELKAHGNVYALAIKNDGLVRADGYNFSGGRLTLSGGSRSSVVNTGSLYARNSNGSGGRVEISGGNVSLAGGTVDASGAAGMDGGSVSVAGETVNVGNGAGVDVSGATAGTVNVAGVSAATVDGTLAAVGSGGAGGSVDVTAASVLVGAASQIDASGSSAGGSVRIGGGFQGSEADIENADSVVVEEGSLILADSSEGDAGRVIVWADVDTTFRGEISAAATGQVGNGGLVEVSGKENLSYLGFTSTVSANGENGILLLDPTDFIIDNVGNSGTTGAALLAQLANSNVVIVTSDAGGQSGNIVVENGTPLIYEEDNSLSLFARGNVIINDDVQNSGSGNINLFAGWNGTGEGALVGIQDPDPGSATDINTFEINGGFSATPTPGAGDIDFADIVGGTYGAWGEDGGSVFINNTDPGGVSVGSAHGETNAFGDLVVIASGDQGDDFAQLGFRDASNANTVNFSGQDYNATGNINVRAKSNVLLDTVGNDSSGQGRDDSHALIGHGGSNATQQAKQAGNGNLRGDISVISSGGDINLTGGRFRSFAQIGHGGLQVHGDKDGDIEVRGVNLNMFGSFYENGAANNTDDSGTRIGHGGSFSHGNIGEDGLNNGGVISGFSGDITVDMSGSVTGNSGNFDIVQYDGAILQIGHGGYRSGIVAFSAVDQSGVSTIRDPDSYGNSRQVGTQASETLGMDLDLAGHTGTITVDVDGDFIWTVGDGRDTGGQVGHGGRQSHGNHAGNVNLNVGGDLRMLRNSGSLYGRTNDNSPYQIGNGGNRAAGAFSGNIRVDVAGSLEMQGGDGSSYAQIGHGGHADGRVTTDGDPNDDALAPQNAHATLTGNIYVNVGVDFAMYAGSGDGNAYAMVGHGGVNRTASGGIADNGTTLIAEELRGHHGNITLDVEGSVTMQGGPKDSSLFTLNGDQNNTGNNNFVQVGHGGVRSSGDHYGAVSIDAGGAISFTAGLSGYEFLNAAGTNFNQFQTGSQSYAMIGHGGFISNVYGLADTGTNNSIQDNGNRSGVGFGVIQNLQVAPPAFGNYIQIDADIENSDITVLSGGSLDLRATQGYGGFRADHRTRFDTETLNGTTLADFISLRGESNFAMIGHGGRGEENDTRDPNDTAINKGNITVKADGAINIIGGQSFQDFPQPNPPTGTDDVRFNIAQIGHGGYSFQTGHEGDIVVEAGGNLTLTAGNSQRDPARIGHGGYESARDTPNTTEMVGSITVISLGSISLTGGAGLNNETQTQFNYSQIGHGAQGANNTPISLVIDAPITVTAANNITLSGGASWQDAYAHIGHGGIDRANGSLAGTIDVTAGDNITLANTSGNTVTAAGQNNERGVQVLAPTGIVRTSRSNYAKIGHGDSEDNGARTASSGGWSGDIFVKAGNNLTSIGGEIGHVFEGSSGTTSTTSNTFIAVGRDDPSSGLGTITTGASVAGKETSFTSGGLGFNGELRIYIPNPAGNAIGAGTILNNPLLGPYTQTPIPDGTRDDEQIATEFTLSFDANGLPSGDFGIPPEGDYPGNAFGFYNVYYAGASPIEAGGENVVVEETVFDDFDFFGFFFEDQFDSFIRGEIVYDYDGYEGQLFSFGIDDAVEGDAPPEFTGWFFEEVFDGALGPRRNSTKRSDNALAAEENSEELIRRKEFAARQVGRGGFSFYVFDPSTSQYSSYRVFGIPQSGFSVAE